MNRVYLDNAATSFPKAPGVGDAMKRYLDGGAYNVGRGEYAESYSVSEQILDTRNRISRLFHAPSDSHVCFTSGVTQALNQFLKGMLKQNDHVITSSMEHNAVMRPLHTLACNGVSVSIAECDSSGYLEPESVEKLFRRETKAVICTHASNVCGTVLPVGGIGKICREKGIWFAVDAAQTAGIFPVDMTEMQIDFLAFPGHKGLGGPQGVGGFIARDGLIREMQPLLEGGTGSVSDSEEQPDFFPDRYESGTLPLPAIIGLQQALKELEKTGVEARHKRILEMTEYFAGGLASIPGVRMAGRDDTGKMREHIGVISVDFSPLDNAVMAYRLEKAGFMTRVGLHCAPRAHKTIGTFPQGTVRFSPGPDNTKEEIDRCLMTVRSLLKEAEQK